MKKKFFVHPKAMADSRRIGARTRIWAFSHMQDGAVIGEDCNIGEQCFIEEGVVVGNRVTIKNGVCLWKGLIAGDNVFIGPNATFTNDLRPRSPRSPYSRGRYENEDWITPVLLGEGISIGANATIVGPRLLGRFCFVAAGSVVIRDVEEFELVAGNPARHIGWVNEYGERVPKRPRK
ncbi:MAG: acyltransferase [Verrucomicrobiae bacterium]|nr:acyltransferase [Verrucomicrobiae bacterium]